MPLLRNTDKSKISKRKNPAARLTWFVEQGYLPEALLNFLALLGYGQPGESEIFDFAQFSASFEWSRVNTVGPVFDLDKLNWLNGEYIRKLAPRRSSPTGSRYAARVGARSPDVVARRRAARAGARQHARRGPSTCSASCSSPRTQFAVDEAAAAKQLGEKGAPVLDAAVPALEALDGWTHRGDRSRRCGRAGRRARAQAAQRLRPGAGGGHRQHRLAAAVRVDGAARPRPVAGPAARRNGVTRHPRFVVPGEPWGCCHAYRPKRPQRR